MYLKTLTLRGFKSFASATTLRFEPGITCVVGPNGSGKSNVVDAFTWVMGQQGAKQLRGGKMEDVVFAGTAHRPALGRAEVTLTIDNSDGALPIDYAEVTISRLLFRTGQSEYAINGSQCRLLDVQELLSDSGLGREMHVIVGQGHLDDILNAGPEARRALIEEAAGVLKHRRRKEKALRKLDAMQANLTRLVDLTTELGRQLKPLGRQAQLARKAAVIQADLRDARLRLLADDYVTLSGELERDEADESAAVALRAELEAMLEAARDQEEELESAAQQHAPRLAAAQETYFALGGLAERLRAVADLAAERYKHLSAPPEAARPGRDPDELEREAAVLREQERELSARLAAAREQLAVAVAARTAAESALAETERKIAADAREAAERAERLARLRGQAGAARSRLAAAQEEAGRLATALAAARTRAEQAQQQYAEMQDHFGGSDDDRAELTAAVEKATADLTAASAQVKRLRKAEHEISERRAGLRARVTALEEAVRRGADASAVLLSGKQEFPGVLGPLAELITVADGAAEAIAAALGASAGAVAVADVEAAVEILGRLRERQAGRAELVIADADSRTVRVAGMSDPSVKLSEGAGASGELAGSPGGTGVWSGGGAGRGPGASGAAVRLGDGAGASGELAGSPGGTGLWNAGGEGPQSVIAAIDLVKAPGELAAAVQRLLGGVLVAPDLAAGLELVRADPGVAVVTTEGDLIGAHWARGGSASGQSLLGLRAAAQAAADELAEAEVAAQRAERQLGEAIEDEEQARQAVSHAQAEMKEVDAAAAEVSGRLGALAGAARAAQDEAGRLVASIAAADRSAEKSRSQLADIERRIATETSQEDAGSDQPGLTDELDGPAQPPRVSSVSAATKQALTDSASAARSTEMDARLEVRTVEERLRAISGRADSLASSAQAERQATIRAAERARRRAAEARVADAVATGARLALTAVDKSLRLADSERQQAEIAHQGRDEELKAVRSRIREATGQLEKVVSTAHGAEVARAGRRLKLEQVEAKAAEEYAVEVEALVAEYGPDVLIPGAEEGHLGTPYNREVQQKRADTAQRQLDQLGKVNPLALEEFAALEERHAFLVTQLEDLRKTRRDLLTVVKEVDDRVQQVFAEAFADTAREFEHIFARVFPGGEGKLVLTEPDDMLATGIEFEARPPGKKVKRLSLLSGGERSLTAIAFLVSIFKARPSPFYVMDEVEAALDDTNVGRLLDIFEELRASSQLIIITHQKRTMEIADSLYGVSMRSDGVSAVISQRLREPEPA
ncbi:MAG TPA: AAA family ATPase [Streptosporangiaceae bacterium]|nr:AAA family ATPase [Streptosporangiaceae bacterium]